MSKDIVSILSVHENPRNSTRSSVHRKLTKSLISTHSDSYGPAVTVTVDGFGMLDGDTVTELPVLSESSHALDFVVETASSHDPDFVVATESSPEVGIESHTAPRQSAPQIVYRYTFRNRNRMHVQVITYGATITAMCVPDRYGRVDDVLLGYDTLQAYVSERAPRYGSPPLLGATIGRCCNRIAGAQYQLDNECDDDGNSNGVVHLTCNGPDGQNHRDGGFHGFDRCVWTPHLSGTVLTLTALSAAGTDGYPGTVMAHATFELLPENTFRVRYTATTTRPTPLNMCCNLLLNLAGHSAGHAELYRHVVTLNGDRTALADERDVDDVPTSGQLCCVGGTVMDLRVPHELGPAMARCPWGGYDGYWCLVRGSEQKHTFAGRVVHPASGRVLEVYTDQPGVRFYTGNRLPDPRADVIMLDLRTIIGTANTNVFKLIFRSIRPKCTPRTSTKYRALRPGAWTKCDNTI